LVLLIIKKRMMKGILLKESKRIGFILFTL